jgi:hypothetical protein
VTASGFCYHQGAIWAGFTGPVLTYFAANQPYTGPGLDKVAPPDGVSTKTVRAVPCSAAARETDGATTCIGIPEGSAAAKGR